MNILIIEDHKDFRSALRHFLELQHVPGRMMEASSGEEGVLLARKSKPGIVIADYALGGINGLEAARQIKKYLPKCNIIMLTIYDSKDIFRNDGNRMVRFYVNKAQLYDRLVPVIRKILKKEKKSLL